ncbi:hypothetical protein MKQ68_15520 [Chitinophaga horti]|uniref:Uncharacterized protein n=1 Tax=Chitinophaga horti TaxID=2920382 RepID=A0ABY6IZK1_9BACT|nr:hypothetical protein [Chitinophaga horti]UYQ91499.1 hypothetical protein MKQ68_15520 [Chitinophaga horti]
MKKLAILFSLSALLAVPASYVNAKTTTAAGTRTVPAILTREGVKALIFGTASTYGLNTTTIDFTVTFTPVNGTPGVPFTYVMPAGFYNPSDQWTFSDGFYDVKVTPLQTVNGYFFVGTNAATSTLSPGNTTGVTHSNVQYYNGGGNVVQVTL